MGGLGIGIGAEQIFPLFPQRSAVPDTPADKDPLAAPSRLTHSYSHPRSHLHLFSVKTKRVLIAFLRSTRRKKNTRAARYRKPMHIDLRGARHSLWKPIRSCSIPATHAARGGAARAEACSGALYHSLSLEASGRARETQDEFTRWRSLRSSLLRSGRPSKCSGIRDGIASPGGF